MDWDLKRGDVFLPQNESNPPFRQLHVWIGIATLAIIEFLLYWRSSAGYFFLDSIYQITARPRNLSELLNAYATVHVWYRPLSQNTINYILHPVLGNHFAFYHTLMVLGHTLIVLLLVPILLKATGDLVSAFTGALVIGAASIAFYTTYDQAFAAELLIAFCFLAGPFFFFKNRPGVASGIFLIALFSKESAVVLPAIILALIFLLPQYHAHWRRWIFRLTPIVGLLALYLAFYSSNFRFEHGAFISIQRSDYPHTLSSVPHNIGNYAYWMMQLPKTWVTAHWVSFPYWRWIAMVLAILISVFAFTEAVHGNVKIRAALAFSIISMLPVVGVDHCMPWHLYVPLIGIATVVSEWALWIRKKLPGALGIVILAAAASGYVCAGYRNVTADREYSWVSVSAQSARIGVEVIRKDLARIHNDTQIVVQNLSGEPPGMYGDGHLFRFASDLPNLEVRYLTPKDPLPAWKPNQLIYALLKDGLKRLD